VSHSRRGYQRTHRVFPVEMDALEEVESALEGIVALEIFVHVYSSYMSCAFVIMCFVSRAIV